MSYVIFQPLPEGHPMIASEEQRCAKCHGQFRAGDITTLIPVDPTGKGGTVLALPAHAACLGWDLQLQRWEPA